MSRTLPPRPDFTQLRHQAKDLLRGHKQKDPAVCGVLRLLRRFASADDAAILGQPLALHEAQFALAMDYGFAGWNALKRHVEKVTGRPSSVRRERDRTYVAGLEGHGIGCKDEHDCSVIACLAGVMRAFGEDDLTYDYLMGAGGAAFRVQMHHPNWCPSAACAPRGYDCVPGAVAATGYRLRWIETQRGNKWLSEGLEEALRAVPESVERGIPAIVAGKESALIVGYRTDGKLVVRPYECHHDGYADADVLGADAIEWTTGDGAWTESTWAVGIIEPHDEPPNRRRVLADSLRLAVTLARTERFGEYLCGFAALGFWIEGLRDDARFAALTPENWFPTAHGNGYCYPCLWSARINAERYLRTMVKEYDEPLRSQLAELADLYRQMHLTLARTKPEFDCVWSLQPWMLKSLANWTRDKRRKEATLLGEVLALERRAIAKIESLLPALQPKSQE